MNPSVNSSLTSLDPLETTSPREPNAPIGSPTLSDSAPSTAFRHSFWTYRRVATYLAIQAAGCTPARVARFDDCGAIAWVMQAADGSDSYRLATNRCRDRFCEACARERRRQVSRNVFEWLLPRFSQRPGSNRPYPVRFLTLTLRHSSSPLEDQVSRLYRSFGALRRRAAISPLVTGGLFFLEVKRSGTDGRWHPHLHVLVEGSYLPQKLLAREWLAVTGDSYIVHVEQIRGASMAASYITKYAGKALDPSVWRNIDRFVDAIRALTGRRTFQTFGEWKGCNLSRDPDAASGWVPLCSFDDLMKGCREEDPRALLIRNYLLGVPTHATTDLDCGHPPPCEMSNLSD